LGDATRVDKLTIRWPSGREQEFKNVSVDRVLTVEEPK
jgi:ASPIC and UnbV